MKTILIYDYQTEKEYVEHNFKGNYNDYLKYHKYYTYSTPPTFPYRLRGAIVKKDTNITENGLTKVTKHGLSKSKYKKYKRVEGFFLNGIEVDIYIDDWTYLYEYATEVSKIVKKYNIKVTYSKKSTRKSGGFDNHKKGILYYLEVLHKGVKYYKIGITNKSVTERYCNDDLAKIKVLRITEFANGVDARAEETRIIREYKKHLYRGNETPLHSAKGNAELFTKDILGLA